MAFVKVKRWVTGIFIVFLLFVFTVPRLYLERGCDELVMLIERAEDEAEPADTLTAIAELYEQKSRVFRLFIDHDAVEAVGTAVAAAKTLYSPEALCSALSGLREAIEDIRRIESLTLGGLF